MRKRLVRGITAAVILLLVGGLALAACAPTPAAPDKSKPIKIGGSLPLTGMFAEQTKDIKAAYEYWAEEINGKGGLLGRPVELVLYDDESRAEKAVTNYERAITVDKVDLLLGGYPGTANVAVMPVAEKYRMVYVSMGGHLQSFEQGYTYSFASPPLLGEWMGIGFKGAIELIPQAQRPKTMALLTMNNAIGQAGRTGLLDTSKELGIQLLMDDSYNLPLADATPLISKAKATNADILYLNSAFDDSVMEMRAAKALGYSPKAIYNTIGSVLPGWVKELGADGDNVLNPMWWHGSLPFPGVAEANKGAQVKYNIPVAPLYFGLGYSWMRTLQLAVEAAGKIDQEAIRTQLATKAFDLPYGKGIKFDKRGLPPAFGYTVQVTNGKVELLWPKEIATTQIVYPRPAWK
ncbi:MAG: amino acid ABC transporter substrate-binding protein [Chloroflexota bacterium]|nr:amino acid ABC transporter substrate-binding protein [Chloroflexota bacterium]